MGVAASLNRSLQQLSRNVATTDNTLHTLQNEVTEQNDPSERAEGRIAAIETRLQRMFPTPTVQLTNGSFRNGTYRIRTPGYYLITEDVVFDPPKLTKPNILYPFPPYQLGFFCCISIECQDVILDLGGHTVAQSPKHALMQRFHALIELSSQPFNTGQGPSAFGNTNASAKNCLISNGYLGRSSHHGIHSSGAPENIVVRDLSIYDFEIAGVHLNGARNVHLQRLHLGPTTQQVPVMATFSHAVFAQSVVQKMNPLLTWRGKSPQEIGNDLTTAINQTVQEVLGGTPISNALFRNDGGMVDGNVYGIVIHGKGVVVGGFKEEVTDEAANQVSLTEICIEGVTSKPNTFKSMTLTGENNDNYGSGGRVHTGPIGDVIDFNRIVGDRTQRYLPNVLSEAQFLCAKWSQGTARCSDAILHWAEHDDGVFAQILEAYPYECSRDAMDHVMKGNLGVFATNVQHLQIVNLILCDMENHGDPVTHPTTNVEDCNFRGTHLSGVVINAVQDVELTNVSINNLKSVHGPVCGIEIVGPSTVHTNNVQVSRLSPPGNRCAMMKTGSDATVTFGVGHQPAQLKE